MGKDVIIACDFANKEEVFSFLDKFKEEKLGKYANMMQGLM